MGNETIVKKVPDAGELLYMKDIWEALGAEPKDHLAFVFSKDGRTATVSKIKIQGDLMEPDVKEPIGESLYNIDSMVLWLNKNYSITYVNGVLTVAKQQLSIPFLQGKQRPLANAGGLLPFFQYVHLLFSSTLFWNYLKRRVYERQKKCV